MSRRELSLRFINSLLERARNRHSAKEYANWSNRERYRRETDMFRFMVPMARSISLASELALPLSCNQSCDVQHKVSLFQWPYGLARAAPVSQALSQHRENVCRFRDYYIKSEEPRTNSGAPNGFAINAVERLSRRRAKGSRATVRFGFSDLDQRRSRCRPKPPLRSRGLETASYDPSDAGLAQTLGLPEMQCQGRTETISSFAFSSFPTFICPSHSVVTTNAGVTS